MSGPHPYELLAVSRTATQEQLDAAYRAGAKRCHPDAGGDPAAFRCLREAYLQLSDPARRRRLDADLDRAALVAQLPVVAISASMQRIGCTVTVPVPRWADCAGCGGAGRRPRRVRRSCRSCDGSGHRVEDYWARDWVLPCTACAGTGAASEECPTCSGGGRTLVALEQQVRMPAGARECVYRLDGTPAFRLRVVPLG